MDTVLHIEGRDYPLSKVLLGQVEAIQDALVDSEKKSMQRVFDMVNAALSADHPAATVGYHTRADMNELARWQSQILAWAGFKLEAGEPASGNVPAAPAA